MENLNQCAVCEELVKESDSVHKDNVVTCVLCDTVLILPYESKASK